MCKAVESECRELMSILTMHEEATGQTISPDKSAISLGALVPDPLKVTIQSALGIFKEDGSGNYLGLPKCFSGSKIEMLAYIKDKLKTRMSGWFLRTLSLGGKEILLKAVALSMPVYAMSCYKLPKATCESITSAMADFWWNFLEEKKKCIGYVGKNYVYQKIMEDLALETFNVSTKLH